MSAATESDFCGVSYLLWIPVGFAVGGLIAYAVLRISRTGGPDDPI